MNELFMVNDAKIIYDAKVQPNRSGCEAIPADKVQVNLLFNEWYSYVKILTFTTCWKSLDSSAMAYFSGVIY